MRHYAKQNKPEQDKYCIISLIREIKKTNKQKNQKLKSENKFVVRGRDWGGGKLVVKIQTFTYKINPGDVMYSFATIVNTILYIYKLLEVLIKRKKNCNYAW